MGKALVDIMVSYGFDIHNDGSCTYHSDGKSSAIDVTLSCGIAENHPIRWKVVDDHLNSPHSGILITIGERETLSRREVFDGDKFPWQQYEGQSKMWLNRLIDRWNANPTSSEIMLEQLMVEFNQAINSLAVKKVVCQHSKPWIVPNLSKQLQIQRDLQRKFKLRQSPRNLHRYNAQVKIVQDTYTKEKEKWWAKECSELVDLEGKELWKRINKLTNYSSNTIVQPLRFSKEDGSKEYVFEDERIMLMMQDYHIKRKVAQTPEDVKMTEVIRGYKEAASHEREQDLLNHEITSCEVKDTFGTSTSASGPDKIHAKFIDCADRKLMSACLSMLWNKMWMEGTFAKQWKKENRVAMTKPDKDDYHVQSAYRTISITDVLGKRMERITAKRLMSILLNQGSDPNQYAYNV